MKYKLYICIIKQLCLEYCPYFIIKAFPSFSFMVKELLASFLHPCPCPNFISLRLNEFFFLPLPYRVYSFPSSRIFPCQVFLYELYMIITWIIGMLLKFFEPSLTNKDSFRLLLFFREFEPFFMSFFDHVRHILFP